ncbi:hypothetical protein SAMN05660748_3887 [Blastococcus aggregatus]|uniref:Uncharacterized protein n=1 Tax=Blastococcus aggregatus TaxID=38502 RepID=A0A285VD41_9ACTN|nr:hypothetical protein [Blastococcus aggregatus]SOC51903.1 hypothetical protein SAMN05660748_3887 [Blastococcus aggregatus]
MTGYAALERSRRRKILKALILGRAIAPEDEQFARDRAGQAAAQLPQGLLRGALFSLFIASSWWSLFPLTVGSKAILVLLAFAVLIYVGGMGFALRMRMWLRREPS